jgi:hypothetical protein
MIHHLVWTNPVFYNSVRYQWNGMENEKNCCSCGGGGGGGCVGNIIAHFVLLFFIALVAFSTHIKSKNPAR